MHVLIKPFPLFTINCKYSLENFEVCWPFMQLKFPNTVTSVCFKREKKALRKSFHLYFQCTAYCNALYCVAKVILANIIGVNHNQHGKIIDFSCGLLHIFILTNSGNRWHLSTKLFCHHSHWVPCSILHRNTLLDFTSRKVAEDWPPRNVFLIFSPVFQIINMLLVENSLSFIDSR